MAYKFCLIAILYLLLMVRHSYANELPIVITHSSNPITSLTSTQLRRIYSARQQFWQSGLKITVVMQTTPSKQHDVFCRTYLGVFPYQIERSWNQMVFSGQAEQPKYLTSDAQVIQTVAETPGAIGYISHTDTLPIETKVLTIQEAR